MKQTLVTQRRAIAEAVKLLGLAETPAIDTEAQMFHVARAQVWATIASAVGANGQCVIEIEE